MLSISRPTTIGDLRSLTIATGGHWFDPDTLRYFRSHVTRAHRIAYTPVSTEDCGYFISHDGRGPEVSDGQGYTIRVFELIRDPYDRIIRVDFDRIGEIGQYDTAVDARKAMRAIVSGGAR
jgi:hypothetical protein